MKTAIIYARVSTDKASDRDTPISSQISECQNWAVKNNVTVLETFKDEGISGAKDRDGRKGLNQALYYAEKNKIDYFLVFDLSRFSRSLENMLVYKSILEKHGTQLFPVSTPLPEDTFTAKIMTAIQGVMDEYYIEKTRQNVNRGLKENAKLGYVRGNLPLGYKSERQLNGKPKIVKDIEGGRIYEKIVEMHLVEHLGSVEIAKNLNMLGYKNRNNTDFRKHAVLGILKNRLYKGEVVLDSKNPNSEFFDHPDLAYITKEKWEEIQITLDERTRSCSAHASPAIFTGILQCSCGVGIETDSTTKNGTKHYYYACRNRRGDSTKKCVQERFRQDLIDDFLLKSILDKIFTKDTLLALESSMNAELQYYKDEAMKDKPEIEKQLADIERKIKNIVMAIANDTIDGSDAAGIISELKENRYILKNRLDVLEDSVDISFRLTMTQTAIKEMIEKVKTEKNIRVCRKLMKNLIDKIVVKGKTFHVYYSDKIIELQSKEGFLDGESSTVSCMVGSIVP